MSVKLYGMGLSHPARAARAMLAHKGIEFDLVDIPAGAQPAVLRLAGFRGRTVPALKVDGKRVQGSIPISRCLEELKPDPPLFPDDRRAAVQEAEAWGERELQPLPRRFFRWGVAHKGHVAKWVAEQAKLPAPGVVGLASKPVALYFARLSRANDDTMKEGLARVPDVLDHADSLIAEGTIGVEGQPTAADFQICSSIAVLASFADLRDAVEERPSVALTERLFPRRLPEIPPFLPDEWLGPVRG